MITRIECMGFRQWYFFSTNRLVGCGVVGGVFVVVDQD